MIKTSARFLITVNALIFGSFFWKTTIGIPKITDSAPEANLYNTSNSSISPYFDLNVVRNVTTTVGQSAFLHCRVYQLGDKSVSWIRKRDLHILTVGLFTYTSDQRFQVMRPDKSENWTLHIKFPQTRDSGLYECQINTEPKQSLPFWLYVIESKAKILGPSDLYVKTGSSVTLTCIISQGPHDLGTVFWYRDKHPIQPDLYHKPRITIDTEWSNTLTSKLHIVSVLTTDSGNYTCVPTVASSASVNIHVISGEHPAAMQHGNTSTAIVGIPVNILFIYCIGVHLITQLQLS